MFKIYKLTSPNGKVYIGRTEEKKLYKRWNYGSGYYWNKELTDDIHKYGWNNFTHEVIDEAFTPDEASLRERKYILLYKSNEPEYGYNKYTNKSIEEKYKDKSISMIHNITLDRYYTSMEDAAKDIDRSRERVRQVLKNGGKVAKTYEFERVEMAYDEFKRLRVDFQNYKCYYIYRK